MKKIVLIIVQVLLIVAVLGVGAYFLGMFIQNQQGYLSFSVTDSNGAVITSTKNNVFAEGKKYTFNAIYTYLEEDTDGKNDTYYVDILSKSDYVDDYYIDGKMHGYDNENYNEQFNLKIAGNKFTITIPHLDKLCAGYKDENGDGLYLGDLFNQDSFVLQVKSHDSRFVIEYAFHFTSAEDILISNIDCGDDIFFHFTPVKAPYAVLIPNLEDNLYFGGDKIDDKKPIDDLYAVDIGDNLSFAGGDSSAPAKDIYGIKIFDTGLRFGGSDDETDNE